MPLPPADPSPSPSPRQVRKAAKFTLLIPGYNKVRRSFISQLLRKKVTYALPPDTDRRYNFRPRAGGATLTEVDHIWECLVAAHAVELCARYAASGFRSLFNGNDIDVREVERSGKYVMEAVVLSKQAMVLQGALMPICDIQNDLFNLKRLERGANRRKPNAYGKFLDADESAAAALDFPALLAQHLMPAGGGEDEGAIARLADDILKDLGDVTEAYEARLNTYDTDLGRRYFKPLASEVHGIFERLDRR